MFRLTILIGVFLSMISFSAAAQPGPGENPDAPELFMPNPDSAPDAGRTLWQRLGPGNGPVRKNSTLRNAHQNVPSYNPARDCLLCHKGQDKNLHNARTTLKCKSCHITRPLPGIRHPAATMFAEHRAEKVCARCHIGATRALGSYIIHEPSPFDVDTRIDFPALFYASWAMVALVSLVALVFAPYVVLWAIKEVRLVLARQRTPMERANKDVTSVERFSAMERMFHTLLALCFMVLAATGLSWMFVETPFGQALLSPFGDYKIAISTHRVVGLILIMLFAVHIVYIIQQVDWTKPDHLSGPDSLVWRVSDFRAFWQHFLWLVGRAEHPAFDHWSWWQKFDYWAVWWGLMIVGITGLVMFHPAFSAEYLDGWVLNVARWVHKIEALLAIVYIFVVHFFIESYRPRAFPLSDHIFHGAADIERMRTEHPAWIARLEHSDQLKHVSVQQPPKVVQLAYFFFGLTIIGLGMFMLFGVLWNITSLS